MSGFGKGQLVKIYLYNFYNEDWGDGENMDPWFEAITVFPGHLKTSGFIRLGRW